MEAMDLWSLGYIYQMQADKILDHTVVLCQVVELSSDQKLEIMVLILILAQTRSIGDKDDLS